MEKSALFISAINSYIETINSTKKPNEKQLTSAEIISKLQIIQQTDVNGVPFFIVETASDNNINIPLMLAEEKERSLGVERSQYKRYCTKDGNGISLFRRE